jgi:hypothetical protein
MRSSAREDRSVTAAREVPVDGGGVLARASARLAWALCAAGVMAAVLGLVYGSWNYDSFDGFLHGTARSAIGAISIAVVGALVATHRPRNPIGWIFCAVGVTQGLLSFCYEYGSYALRTAPGAVPAGRLAFWAATWMWAPGVGLLFTFVPLLFPDGRLPSRRWRPVAWLSAVAVALASGLPAALLWPLQGPALLAYDAGTPLQAAPEIALGAALLLMVLCGLACVTALFVRFRRAQGIERQQLKWFLFASVVTLAVVVEGQLGSLLLVLPLVVSIPVAVGIAILRYRLYDIDRLINRTLVYGLLTAMLGLGYAGVVLLLGQLFGGIGGQPPSWAVAGATLAVAAVFRPARRRVQEAVDRRFNRRRYDAAKTVEAFSARLREQTDLGALSAELLAVVDQTMEPTRVSLWLRPSAHGFSGTRRTDVRPTSWAY